MLLNSEFLCFFFPPSSSNNKKRFPYVFFSPSLPMKKEDCFLVDVGVLWGENFFSKEVGFEMK